MRTVCIVPEWTWASAELSPVRVPAAAVVWGAGGCQEFQGQGFCCTRRRDHEGRHAAALCSGEVLAVWS